MDVGISDHQDSRRVPAPRTCSAREQLQDEEKRQTPETVPPNRGQPIVDLLRPPRHDDKLDQEEHVSGDGQQIRLERIEAEVLERDGNICRDWRGGNEHRKADGVHRPQVIIHKSIP